MGSRILAILAIALLASGGGNHDAPIGGDGPGGGDAGVDGNNPNADAAVGPLCSGMVCPMSDVCCIGVVTECKPTGMCPSQSFACDGPEDCPSGQCCYGNGGQGGSQCRASCTSPACHVDQDCPVGMQKCCPKAFTPMYKVCQSSC